MQEDVIDLDNSKYEVIESESKGRITSEEVKKKLENPEDPFLGPIRQEDFDDKDQDSEDYTLTDYLWIDSDDYPRNLSDNKNKVAGSVTALGLHVAVTDGLDVRPSTVGYTLAGITAANYAIGLHEQEQDLSTAVRNSMDDLNDSISKASDSIDMMFEEI